MSRKTIVVNKHHGTLYDVYIGRGSLWGNPYPITKELNRFEAIKRFEEYLLTNEKLLNNLENIYGKTLGCFCTPTPCHGDILAYYADFIIENNVLPAIKGILILYPNGDPDPPKKTLFDL